MRRIFTNRKTNKNASNEIGRREEGDDLFYFGKLNNIKQNNNSTTQNNDDSYRL